MINKDAKILSIETSGSTCGIAISKGDKILADYSVHIQNLHDKLLAELTRRILSDTGIKVEKLDAVAVSSGPGSFTGLRIGISFAKALCFDTNIKLISIPTLSAMAMQACALSRKFGKQGVFVNIASHKDLLYYQKFDNDFVQQNDIQFCTLEEYQQEQFEHYLVCGEVGDLSTDLDIVNQRSVSNIARLAQSMYAQEIFTDADTFVPEYVQEFVPKGYEG